MKRLSSIPAPAVAGVVRGRTAAEAIAEIRNCYYAGADMIDLHLSCLEENDRASLEKIISSTSLPVLALNYVANVDTSALYHSEEERIASFLRAVEAGAAGIDMQGYTFHRPSRTEFCGQDIYSFTKGNPKEIVTDPAIIEQQCALVEKVHSMGAEVLLSCHPGIPMTCDQVVDLAHFLEERNPDIIKIITTAHTQEDLDECIRTMTVLRRELKTPVAFHANGKAGIPSRIINPLLGSQIAFCVERYAPGFAMEQPDLRTVRATVDNARKIYGV